MWLLSKRGNYIVAYGKFIWILHFSAITNWNTSEGNIEKYIFLFLMEKNWDKIYMIFIQWIELAFTLYENQKEKKIVNLMEWN